MILFIAKKDIEKKSHLLNATRIGGYNVKEVTSANNRTVENKARESPRS